MENVKSKDNEVKKLSFSKRIKAELLKRGFTENLKTIKMKPDDKEKSKE